MKNQLHDYLNLVKGFMRKNALLILSLKVLKVLIVVFLFSSCSGKPEPSSKPDTILVDSIPGNTPGDSVNFKNEEEEEPKEENNENPLVPQES